MTHPAKNLLSRKEFKKTFIIDDFQFEDLQTLFNEKLKNLVFPYQRVITLSSSSKIIGCEILPLSFGSVLYGGSMLHCVLLIN